MLTTQAAPRPPSLPLLPAVRAAHDWAEQHCQEGQSENGGCSQKTERKSLQTETVWREKSLRHGICLILIQNLSNSLPSSFSLVTYVVSRVLPQNCGIHCRLTVQLVHTAHPPRDVLDLFCHIFQDRWCLGQHCSDVSLNKIETSPSNTCAHRLCLHFTHPIPESNLCPPSQYLLCPRCIWLSISLGHQVTMKWEKK